MFVCLFVCLFYWKFEEGQFEDYTEEEEQRDWKKEETNKATYDANILLHQLHTGRIVFGEGANKSLMFVCLFY